MSTTTSSLSGQLVGRALTQAFRLARGDRGLHDESTLDDLATYVTRLRPKIDALAERGRVPRDTRIEVDRDAPVPGEWVRPRASTGDHDGPLVLHLHGGAYTLCSPVTHRGMTRNLARTARGIAWVPDYRLAPEHPFPAALDDAVATYRWLLEDRGFDPARIAVTGDSAGGGLGLGLLLRARDEDLPMPACYVGLSPWTDLTGASPSIEANNGRDVLFGAVPTPIAGLLGELYAEDTADPLVSPVYADLRGLPPMLVHVGVDELIRDDGLRLVERAREHGVRASAGSFAGMWHVFQAFPLPESRRSLREIGGFIRRHTAVVA